MLSPRMYRIVAPRLYRLAALVGMHRVTRRRIRVRRVRIDVGLGLRLALVADLHADPRFMDRAQVARVVDAIEGVGNVDAVCMPGDFVGHDGSAVDWAAPELARITAPVFASLGNHDHDSDVDTARVVAALERNGIVVLTNAAVAFGNAWIAGIDSMRGAPDVDAALRDVPAGAGCIVLGHEPALALRHDQVLHLAGHTHHGQVRIPFLPPLYLPSHSKPYPCGLYEVARADGSLRWVYTTAGVGSTTLPVRIGAPPEIVVIEC
jgi:predicted MPP superfamily phosphohydrolase